MTRDVHNYARRVERFSHLVRTHPTISDRNKQLILGFADAAFGEGISKGRVARYLWDLKTMTTKWTEKDFDVMGIGDVRSLVAGLEKDDHYARSTKRDLKITLRKFFKWLKHTDDWPAEVKWIRTGVRGGRIKLPEDMLTEDDIRGLLQAADNPRDRALIALLYESGCRVGEIMFLRIKHVAFDRFGAQLVVNGKTGFRRVRIFSSAPLLSQWLNQHPNRDDPEASLWTRLRADRQKPIVDYPAFYKALRVIARRAGIKKKVNPHNFRHSRATFLANHLTEAQMKEYFGWVQGSNMAAVYVHLSGRDVDGALMKMYGVEPAQTNEESHLQPIPCSRCQEANAGINKFCQRCGMILGEKAALRMIARESERNEADKVLDKMLEDGEFKSAFLRALRAVTQGQSAERVPSPR